MDFGQPQKTDNDPDFFTSGAGTNLETENNFEAENNLDLTNNQTDWSSPLERNQREIGNKALSTPGESQNPNLSSESAPTPEINLDPELGQVVQMDMPPNHVSDDKELGVAETAALAVNMSSIKTKDKLAEEGVKEVDNIITKLNQDGNIADFYETARDMAYANLKNSYNREVNK